MTPQATSQPDDTPVHKTHVPIAICGYGHRLPGGLDDDQAMWELLESRGFVQESVDKRYGKGAAPYDGMTDSPNALASPYEGHIRDGKALEFDCALFGISANEAKRMDPQIKMMLQATWDALQCAGMDIAALHNSATGVFTGHQTSSIASWKAPYGSTGSDVPGKAGSMIANRISYHFNWMGPSFGLATACSSGITALDAAIKSLNSGEIGMAACGAVQYLGSVQASVGFNHLGIISNTGTARSFDKDSNGYMRAEGAFMFILKRLSDAERDGDKIFGVVRGCGLNAAGAELDAQVMTQGRMIVAPVQHAQEALMRKMLELEGIDPKKVDYVEAHATGTKVGDAIEGNAIANVYGSPDRETPLRVASVRSNFGHMEAASFTSSLLKIILMMERKKFLPISSHFKEANPNIPFEAQKMKVQTECEPFPVREEPILVGINSFGFGGANGHCILEEYKPSEDWSAQPSDVEGKVYVAPLSAKSEEALIEGARRLEAKLGELESDVDAYTLMANLSVHMTHHRVRSAFSAADLPSLKTSLAAFVERADTSQLKENEVTRLEKGGTESDGSPTVVMVFPGQGSQWAGCGRELYKAEPVFREVVDVIDAEWIKLTGGKLSTVAFDEEVGAKLNDCFWAQPVTFLLQVGIFEMLKVHGIHATAVFGHSAGEAAAAYASGAYTLEDACFLVYHRSRLQDKLAGSGRMLVMMQDKASMEEVLKKYGFDDTIEIACTNSPNNTVVCGAEDIIEKFREKLEEDDLPPGKLIPGNIAFHSRHMLPIHDELLEVLGVLDGDEPRTTTTPMISTVTGKVQPTIDAEYWWKNVREPVNLLDTISNIHKHIKPDVIIEVSPHITLRSPIRDCYTELGETLPSYIYSVVRGMKSTECFATTVGNCFKFGLPVDFHTIYPRPRPMAHMLPRYAMKQENAMDPLIDSAALLHLEQFSAGPMLGKKTPGFNMKYEAIFSAKHFSWMTDHKVQGAPIVPAAGYLELLLEAFHGELIHIVSARLLAPFVLNADPKYIHTDIKPCGHAAHRFEFTITSCPHSAETTDSTVHCIGVVERTTQEKRDKRVPQRSLASWFEGREDKMENIYADSESFYSSMVARLGDGFEYGPFFHNVKRVDRDITDQKLRVDIAIDNDKWAAWDKMGYTLHPSLLDGALQVLICYMMETPDFVAIPQMIHDFILLKKPSSGRLTIVFKPQGNIENQKGQLAIGLGERASGEIFIYDGETAELVAYLGEYASHASHPSHWKTDKKKFKHFMSWQPKVIASAESIAEPARIALENGSGITATTTQLVNDIISKAHPKADTPFFANVGECVIGVSEAPTELAVEGLCSTLANKPVQYTVLSSDTEFLSETYKKLGQSNPDAHLRFIENTGDYDKGFLRPAMFELLVLRHTVGEETAEEYSHALELVAPGGFLLVESVGSPVDVPADWECLWKLEGCALLKAPSLFTKEGADSISPDSDIVVDDSLGFAEHWRSAVVKGEVAASSDTDFSKANLWERVDYFAMAAGEEDNVELHDGASKLTEFVKQFAALRTGLADLPPCLFTIFTSGAMLDVTSPCQTGIWGAVRSMEAELGAACNVEFHLVDVATKEDLLLVPYIDNLRERELCVHNGLVWTCRMVNERNAMPLANLSADDEECFKLHTDCSGVIADLEFKTIPMAPLGPNDVEVSVKASALNFRDIMVGLGRLPLLSYERSALGRTIGIECAGVVARCGSDVTNVSVGDNVLAMQGGCVANRIRCEEKFVFKMPSNLSFIQGSSVVSVYVTAYYSLVYLGRMRKGQSVLIHSAMGGVGQAAIALAKLCGARIYGTAGSDEKRAALLEMGCTAVFNSRSTSWYADLMEATSGRGVDLVLNSLAGEHVDLCLDALAPGGCHYEIGKVDIFADRPMKMAVFRKNVAYRAVDIDRLMLDDPELMRQMGKECLELLEKGSVPPLPTTLYSYADYNSALVCMMNGQHRGKLVLTAPEEGTTMPVVDSRNLYGTGADGTPRTVVLSGCLGGFGLRVLSYVVALGAKHVVLLDRDQKRRRSEEWVRYHSNMEFVIKEQSKDARIEIVYADVGKYDHVVNAIAEVSRLGMPEIGSVFHLAGILDDKMIDGIDRESFAAVYEPKANGAWNLHRATSHCKNIDHFVMLSSTSSAFGNPGQVNYSAANAFQDGLAEMRKQNGLPGLSFCMGAVLEAGMAARNPQLLQMMKANGMPAISGIFAIEGLDSAIRSGKHSTFVAALSRDLAADFDSTDFLRSWAQLVANKAAFKLSGGGTMSKEAIVALISERVAGLCGVEEVDPTEPFSSYGLNSISVAELGAFLKNEMSYTVGAMELMTSATCENIATGIIQAREGATADQHSLAALSSASSEESEYEESLEWNLPPVSRAPSRFTPSIAFEITPRKSRETKPAVAGTKGGSSPTTSQVVTTTKKSPVIGQIEGTLPQKVQETLDELLEYLRNCRDPNAGPAVPTADIRHVLLTGATGFVGRHFIADLLNQTEIPIEKLYLPIRAGDDSEALQRLIGTMEECGTWDESFRSRIVAFSGDLRDEHFGATPELYEKLASSVDAIYHFASSLSLAGSFESLRKDNNHAMKPVIRLCLTQKRKHLFHASTIGIFPQYFCRFTNEMMDMPVEREAMPDIALMKKIFPLGIGGYPWSKFVNELLVYELGKDIPIAVLRLPVMNSNSATGYTVSQDPLVRATFAMIQLRMIIGNSQSLAVEDSNICNQMMLGVTLNPARKNTIYHCSSLSPCVPTDCQPLDMIGYTVKRATYQEFKAECLKLGKKSPLHSYWVLFDHFSDYWVNNTRAAKQYPIDISTVVEDSVSPPPVSNYMTCMTTSMEYMFQYPDQNTLPFDVDLLRVPLNVETVLAPAQYLCNKLKLNFDTVVPPSIREGLFRICDELDVPVAMQPAVAFNLTSKLESRIHLHKLLEMHPEITKEPVESPLFIVGLNRSGTTFLHRMLESSGQFEAPHLEEIVLLRDATELADPTPQATKERNAAIQSMMGAFIEGTEGIHEMGIGIAEEDVCAHSCSFASLEYDLFYRLPRYREWLDTQPLDDVYAFHKQWMQSIAWRRRRANQSPPQRWCFKMPWHARSLPALFKTYPDAKLVHTHRAPEDVAGSWCSLVERQRYLFVHDIKRTDLGPEQVDSLGRTLSEAMKFRAERPEYANRWMDVQFTDLISNPAVVAGQVISHAGESFGDESTKKVEEYIQVCLDRRSEGTRHEYDIKDYGISPEAFQSEIFTKYREQNIPQEA